MIRSSKKSREKSKKMLLIIKNKKKPRLTVVSLAGEERCVTILKTAARETRLTVADPDLQTKFTPGCL